MTKKKTIHSGSGISGQSNVDSSVWGDYKMEMREITREEYMKDNKVKTYRLLVRPKNRL